MVHLSNFSQEDAQNSANNLQKNSINSREDLKEDASDLEFDTEDGMNLVKEMSPGEKGAREPPKNLPKNSPIAESLNPRLSTPSSSQGSANDFQKHFKDSQEDLKEDAMDFEFDPGDGMNSGKEIYLNEKRACEPIKKSPKNSFTTESLTSQRFSPPSSQGKMVTRYGRTISTFKNSNATLEDSEDLDSDGSLKDNGEDSGSGTSSEEDSAEEKENL